MREWARARGYVVFDSSTGFELSDGAIVSPDTSLVAIDRWRSLSAEQREDYPPLAPDIAIELVSKTDRPAAVRRRLTHLREQGTPFVVLLDPYRSEVWSDGSVPSEFPTDFEDVLSAADVQ
jgi:Uma2 family endonuclease